MKWYVTRYGYLWDFDNSSLPRISSISHARTAGRNHVGHVSIHQSFPMFTCREWRGRRSKLSRNRLDRRSVRDSRQYPIVLLASHEAALTSPSRCNDCKFLPEICRLSHPAKRGLCVESQCADDVFGFCRGLCCTLRMLYVDILNLTVFGEEIRPNG